MLGEFLPILLGAALVLSFMLVAGAPEKLSTWYGNASVAAAWFMLLSWTQVRAFPNYPWGDEQHAAWLFVTLAGLACIIATAVKITGLLKYRRRRRLH